MNLPFLRRYGHRQSTLTYIEIQTYTVKKIVNDINTQIGCIDGFEMTTRYLKMEDIKVIFKKMLKEHELSIVQNNQEMFHKQEQSTPPLISGNSSLTNRRLDSLSKETNDQKESLEFSKNEYDNKFKNLGNRKNKSNEGRRSPEIKTIMGETDAKLVDSEHRSRQNNLRFEGIKGYENESWGIAKTTFMVYWETNLKWALKTLSLNKHIELGRKTRIGRGL